MPVLKSIAPWIWPGGLVAGTSVLLAWEWVETPWLAGIVGRYGWLVLVASALLAWRFRRSRVVALAALLGLLWLLEPRGGTPGLPGPWEAAGVAVVAAVGLLSLVRDRRVLSPLGALHIVLAVGAAAAAIFTVPVHPEAWRWLDAFRIGSLGPRAAPVLPGLWAAAMVPTLFQAIRLGHPLERGLVWTGVLLLMAFLSPPASLESQIHLTAAGLILLLSLVETSHVLAYRDELTGLPTRRALTEFFDDLGSRYTVAMVDVDHFKRFNDRHGHDVGDQILKLVASRLARVRGGGTAFRYGGEEFTVVFPGMTRDEVMDHLEDLRTTIEGTTFTLRRFGRPRKKPEGARGLGRKGGRKLSVTVSMGVAERLESLPEPEAVLEAADQALFRAKKKGRNRISR